jgi:hypothetical protein
MLCELQTLKDGMKKSLFKTQVAKIVFLFISFVLTTFILGGFILNGLLRVPSQIANVIVIIAILLITWRAYKKEGKNLSELGLNLKLREPWLWFIRFTYWRTFCYSSCLYNCVYKRFSCSIQSKL